MSPTATWLDRARAFLADDPDPDTRAELSELLAARETHEAELIDRFATPLEFGTAGLRGLIGAGDNRMNRRVVAQTTAGLCAYLIEQVPGAAERGLCLGFDGRHKSRELADEVIAIACGAGFVVHAFDAVAPTPLLAFAVLERAAVGGVMITASHNPAAYNGYKVYLQDGAQLRPPHDAGIAQAIARVGSVLALPRVPQGAARATGLLRTMADVEARYLSGLQTQLDALSPRVAKANVRVAYTALHGVGAELAQRAGALAGVSTWHSVAGQQQPDPDFPTVKFPNPEEPGAMDAVLALGQETQADVAIANDPDADRLALGIPAADGGMRRLSGNELAVLLADYLLQHAPRDGRNLVVNSLVSTPMIARIALAHGARSEITLTGFKWIMRRALELRASEGLRLVLGCEEALGYCIGDLVHDKDGIAAAAHSVRMTAWHAAHGRSLSQAIEQLFRQHGLFESRQVSITLPGRDGLERMRACMTRLRAQPPLSIAGASVVSVLDLEAGVHTRDGVRAIASLPRSDVLVLELSDAQRITVRPSGTEPKLKIYLDCVSELSTEEPLTAALARTRLRLDAIERDIRALLQLD